MSNRVTIEQISLLRNIMCYLACHPNRHTPADLSQVLRQLVEGLELAAAGIYWHTGEQLQPLAHWPPQFTPPPPGPVTDSSSEPDQPTIVPMHCDGTILGQLWLVTPRQLTPDEEDFVTLAANQLAIIWQNTRLYSQLATLATRRGELLRRLIEADEQCSRRVSRELHDEISQALTALLFEVETIMTTDRFDQAEHIEHHLNHLGSELVRVTDEVNRIVLDLRPTLLENNGLVAALEWYGAERLRLAGVKLHLSTSGQCIPQLSECVTTMLYRIGQEALANIARHAQAKNAFLTIICTNNHLSLTIDDDGCGFEVADFLKNPTGLQGIGLLGMQERAHLIDGELTITSKPGRGTHLNVKVPLNNEVVNGAH